MIRRQRLLAAVRREPLDRVPYATYNLHPYSDNAHTRDASYAALLDRVHKTAGSVIKAGADGEMPGLTREREGIVETTVEGSGDTRTEITVLHTPKGDLTRLKRAPEGKPARVIKTFVTSNEDMARYMSIPYEPPRFDLSRARAICEAAGDRAIVSVGYLEPMQAIANLFDFEEFCIRCARELPTILKYIDWAYERCAANLRLLMKACAGTDVLFLTSGPEICTPPLMSPALFSRMVTPYLTRLVQIVHESGKLAALHCHGHVREVFPDIIRSGIDLLEPVEPPVQGNIGIDELLDQAAGRICLMGHIQDQEFYSAPPGFMTKRVEAIAKVVNGRTGYIMTPTCTPFEHPCSPRYERNFLEWLDAAERLLR